MWLEGIEDLGLFVEEAVDRWGWVGMVGGFEIHLSTNLFIDNEDNFNKWAKWTDNTGI